MIDGDLSDYRPGDPSPCIVGLRAKGDAIGDASGFVRGGALVMRHILDAIGLVVMLAFFI